jgi:hypothetical protein
MEGFTARREQTAFAALLMRCHGPMALGVYRGVLQHEQVAFSAGRPTEPRLSRSPLLQAQGTRGATEGSGSPGAGNSIRVIREIRGLIYFVRSNPGNDDKDSTKLQVWRIDESAGRLRAAHI